MNTDVILVAGLVVGALAIPSALSAFAESRPPRAAAGAILVGGGLIIMAFMLKPGGYTAAQIPGVFSRVITGILH